MARVIGLMFLGALLACALLEALFRILPVSTSTSMDYYSDPHILSYEPHHSFLAAAGWNLEHPERIRANNAGFVASRDFVSDPNAVALIGDSFVEASMLDAPQRLESRIEHELGGRPVYALGAPGSSLLDYAERIRLSATRYSIRDFVIIIEEGDVLQAICGSGQVHGRCYDERSGTVTYFRQPEAGTLKRIFRHSALAQYLTSQLKLDIGSLLSPAKALARTPQAPPVSPESARELATIVAAFFSEVAKYEPRHLVLVLEDRTVSGARRSQLQQLGRDLLSDKGRAAGAVVVDTGPLFRGFIDRTGLSVAVSPRDHHWNGAATERVAGSVAEALR